MFSPYYAAARRRGPGDPLAHVSVNAILYGPRGKRWAMTERGHRSLDRSKDHIAIGPSSLRCEGHRLVIEIDEWTVPIPRRLRGRITVELGPLFDRVHALDAEGRHGWRPIAPFARASVDFDRPGRRWQGSAYVDTNAGVEPIEAAFRAWNWSRMHAGASTRLLYDVEPRRGPPTSLGLEYGADGTIRDVDPGPVLKLSATGWRVARATRAGSSEPPRVSRTLEDTPFYSRSLLTVADGAGTRQIMHESVDLDRFSSRWVQVLLPFRMPRLSR